METTLDLHLVSYTVTDTRTGESHTFDYLEVSELGDSLASGEDA